MYLITWRTCTWAPSTWILCICLSTWRPCMYLSTWRPCIYLSSWRPCTAWVPEDHVLLEYLKTMYCLMASILFWNSALAAFIWVIMEPMLPTMEAKTSTPTRKSKVTNRYSALCTGIGVSPSVITSIAAGFGFLGSSRYFYGSILLQGPKQPSIKVTKQIPTSH